MIRGHCCLYKLMAVRKMIKPLLWFEILSWSSHLSAETIPQLKRLNWAHLYVCLFCFFGCCCLCLFFTIFKEQRKMKSWTIIKCSFFSFQSQQEKTIKLFFFFFSFWGPKWACNKCKPLCNSKIYTVSVQLSIVHEEHRLSNHT